LFFLLLVIGYCKLGIILVMIALGIETSCDDTTAAVVENKKLLSNVAVSSLRYHKKYGGIIPEIATRNHAKFIDKVVSVAINKAKISFSDIDVIGVTYKPGLVGALIVGLNFAKALSLSLNKPLIGINHLHAHIFSPFINYSGKIPFPFIGLVVSGGHTQIFKVSDFDDIKTLGRTRDDAAGEAFDKVARNFGLPYPGGMYIDKLSKNKYKDEFKFNVGKMGLDFSFSGVKTALIYKKMEMDKKKIFTKSTKVKLLSSFQESVTSVITEHVVLAAKKHQIKTIACGGGVMNNSRLRELLKMASKKENLKLYLAKREFSADNAAMVAELTFYLYNKNKSASEFTIEAASQ